MRFVIDFDYVKNKFQKRYITYVAHTFFKGPIVRISESKFKEEVGSKNCNFQVSQKIAGICKDLTIFLE
jgi:hypothetical protein